MATAKTIVNKLLEADPDAPEPYLDWLGQKVETGPLEKIRFGAHIHLSDEDMIRENAHEAGIDVDSQAFWDEVERCMAIMESHCLQLLRESGLHVSDEGHDETGARVASVWIDTPEEDRKLALLKAVINWAEGDWPSTTSGTMDYAFGANTTQRIYAMTEDAARFIDVTIEFTGTDALVEWSKLNLNEAITGDPDDPEVFLRSYVPRMMGRVFIDFDVIKPHFPDAPANWVRDKVNGLDLFRYNRVSEMREVLRQMKADYRQRGPNVPVDVITYRYRLNNPQGSSIVRGWLDKIGCPVPVIQWVCETNAPIWFFVSAKEFNAYMQMVYPQVKLESIDDPPADLVNKLTPKVVCPNCGASAEIGYGPEKLDTHPTAPVHYDDDVELARYLAPGDEFDPNVSIHHFDVKHIYKCRQCNQRFDGTQPKLTVEGVDDPDDPQAFLQSYRHTYYKLFYGSKFGEGAFVGVYRTLDDVVQAAKERKLRKRARCVWAVEEVHPDAPEGVFVSSEPTGFVYDILKGYTVGEPRRVVIEGVDDPDDPVEFIKRFKPAWRLLSHIKNGHFYFIDDAGRVAVADYSMRNQRDPGSADDGLLVLDKTKPITRYRGIEGRKMWHIPVTQYYGGLGDKPIPSATGASEQEFADLWPKLEPLGFTQAIREDSLQEFNYLLACRQCHAWFFYYQKTLHDKCPDCGSTDLAQGAEAKQMATHPSVVLATKTRKPRKPRQPKPKPAAPPEPQKATGIQWPSDWSPEVIAGIKKAAGLKESDEDIDPRQYLDATTGWIDTFLNAGMTPNAEDTHRGQFWKRYECHGFNYIVVVGSRVPRFMIVERNDALYGTNTFRRVFEYPDRDINGLVTEFTAINRLLTKAITSAFDGFPAFDEKVDQLYKQHKRRRERWLSGKIKEGVDDPDLQHYLPHISPERCLHCNNDLTQASQVERNYYNHDSRIALILPGHYEAADSAFEPDLRLEPSVVERLTNCPTFEDKCANCGTDTSQPVRHEESLDAPIRPCVHCGYCCKKAPCAYGEVDPATGHCKHLTADNRCAQCGKINDPVSPAFGAGCCSPMNTDRLAIVRKLKESVDDPESYLRDLPVYTIEEIRERMQNYGLSFYINHGHIGSEGFMPWGRWIVIKGFAYWAVNKKGEYLPASFFHEQLEKFCRDMKFTVYHIQLLNEPPVPIEFKLAIPKIHVNPDDYEVKQRHLDDPDYQEPAAVHREMHRDWLPETEVPLPAEDAPEHYIHTAHTDVKRVIPALGFKKPDEPHGFGPNHYFFYGNEDDAHSYSDRYTLTLHDDPETDSVIICGWRDREGSTCVSVSYDNLAEFVNKVKDILGVKGSRPDVALTLRKVIKSLGESLGVDLPPEDEPALNIEKHAQHVEKVEQDALESAINMAVQEFELRVDKRGITTAREADQLAAEVGDQYASMAGYENGSDEYDWVVSAVNNKAGEMFPGQWEDYVPEAQRKAMTHVSPQSVIESTLPSDYPGKTWEQVFEHFDNKPPKQLDVLVRSIRQRGIQYPIHLAEHAGQKYVDDGHHRLWLACRLDLKTVPVTDVPDALLEAKLQRQDKLNEMGGAVNIWLSPKGQAILCHDHAEHAASEILKKPLKSWPGNYWEARGRVYQEMFRRGWMRIAIPHAQKKLMVDYRGKSTEAQWEWIYEKAGQDKLAITDDQENIILDYREGADVAEAVEPDPDDVDPKAYAMDLPQRMANYVKVSSNQEAERLAIEAYEQAKGKVYRVNYVMGWRGDDTEEVHGDFVVRIMPTSIEDDILRWHDRPMLQAGGYEFGGYLDPVWEVEVLDGPPEDMALIADMRNFYIDATSYTTSEIPSTNPVVESEEDVDVEDYLRQLADTNLSSVYQEHGLQSNEKGDYGHGQMEIDRPATMIWHGKQHQIAKIELAIHTHPFQRWSSVSVYIRPISTSDSYRRFKDLKFRYWTVPLNKLGQVVSRMINEIEGVCLVNDPTWPEMVEQFKTVMRQFRPYRPLTPKKVAEGVELPPEDEPENVLPSAEKSLVAAELKRLDFGPKPERGKEWIYGEEMPRFWYNTYKGADGSNRAIYIYFIGGQTPEVQTRNYNAPAKAWYQRGQEPPPTAPAQSQAHLAAIIHDLDSAMQKSAADSLPVDQEYDAIQRVIRHHRQWWEDTLDYLINTQGGTVPGRIGPGQPA